MGAMNDQELAAFEHWAENNCFDLKRNEHGYYSAHSTSFARAGWAGRAELAGAAKAALYPGMQVVLREVAAERRRQVEEEGWTAAHDDAAHSDGQLALAAVCYALPDEYRTAIYTRDTGGLMNRVPRLWPWAGEWWRPGAVRRMLIKACALLVAEIERLDRAEQRHREAS